MDKLFQHLEVEPRVYASWEEAGVFSKGVHVDKPNADAESFCIVLPPPNVTGSLHIGHALNATLQDILTRRQRMRGRDVLWQPGMDHAGIATQMLVERRLAEREGLSRRDLGREAFIARVWQWKAESGDRIYKQMRSLGTSCDWERSRFTMDEGLSAAVRKTFIDLYRDGLIYRDKRLVNWDPALRTAISDLEVVQRPARVFLWHIRYPLEDSDKEHITIATTRPETMFADTAVAVHPEDPRYREFIGRHALLPLLGRRLPIIADEYVDQEQGSGALKVTPAHDFNDFEIGRRHKLEIVNVLSQTACLNDVAPPEYRGMERYSAREKLVADLEARGLLEKVDESEGSVPVGDRSGSVVEPYLTDQWYADAPSLAGEAIRVVSEEKVVFVPKAWEKTYFDWMHRIEPWCISRQLWWGHRIPAWYGEDGEVFVAEDAEGAMALARKHYGTDEDVPLRQDEDVLDTWFSSALWPFSTLGWPEETEELKRYYPTDVLVTSFDIIFFWVARMIMFALYFRREIPFRHVYIHALVRDAKGQKMSKSKGNILDPLLAIEEYGADALRFTLAALAGQGRDIKLSRQSIRGYRNFTTKLWNAARFCHMNECREAADFDPGAVKTTINRWMVGELTSLAARVDTAIDDYRFDEAAGELYQFFWHRFCDWYLEFIKEEIKKRTAAEARACAGWALARLLSLLHPFMPFITEEIHARIGGEQGLLATSAWPELSSRLRDEASCKEMEWLLEVVETIRSARGWMNVPASERLAVEVQTDSEGIKYLLQEYHASIFRLGSVEFRKREAAEEHPGAIDIMVGESGLSLFLGDVVNLTAQKLRLEGALERIEGNIGRIEDKLGNRDFLARAPEEVVSERRERLRGLEREREVLCKVLKGLGVRSQNVDRPRN